MTDPQRFKERPRRRVAKPPGLRDLDRGQYRSRRRPRAGTLLKAWNNMHAYTEGTNLRAWLFTILRNTFYSRLSQALPRDRGRRQLFRAARCACRAGRSHGPADFRTALAKLPSDQREALILVGASGFSYEEAAEICGCALGTIKSRINRARSRLADLLAVKSVDDFGPDARSHAVLASGPHSTLPGE